MVERHESLTVIKKQLSNGLTILAQPMRNFPRVDVQLWYHIGSKHEAQHQKGMAHFIEHMLFKGTKNLSETDVNLITHKLSGYSNAFTSQDYTGYVFRLPSNVWHYALMVMSDCMKNARFDPQMMASEVKAVVEELRLFRDDYQTTALETLTSSLFGMHPYHYPIIGSTFHLEALTQKDLVSFYHDYYTPNNATLVVVGDVDHEEIFKQAEHYFGAIKPTPIPEKKIIPLQKDLMKQAVTLYRDIAQPWSCFIYTTPCISDKEYFLSDMVALLLGGDKSSRLYERLVLKEELVSDVECFTFDLFEQGMLCISVSPYKQENRQRMSDIIVEEIARLKKDLSASELQAVKKNIQLDFTFLIEQSEKRASFIGTHFVGTGEEQRLSSYMSDIESCTKEQIKKFIGRWLRPTVQHETHVLPVEKDDLQELVAVQKQNELDEVALLSHHQRSSVVETGRMAEKIPLPAQPSFVFPVPEHARLTNGLELITHHNPTVPYVYIIFNLKANPYYDPDNQQGIFMLLTQLLVHETAEHEAIDFHRLLQEEGIRLFTSFDSIKLYCLAQDFERALDRLAEVLTQPVFKRNSIKQLKQQQLSDIDAFWDSPASFVDQLAREYLYKETAFYKNPLGSKESVTQLTSRQLQAHYKKVVTPDQSSLIIVGDLTGYDVKKLTEKKLGTWTGKKALELDFSEKAHPAHKRHHEINRDQTVLTFFAPTITTINDDYYPLLLLDIILMGGGGASTNYRLFDLREQTGLFYSIEGSFLYGNGIRPSITLIKTVVTPEQSVKAEQAIMNILRDVFENGVTQEEFEMAKNVLLSSSIELFETNTSSAHSFLFLKKCMLSFNLFDKQEGFLNILRHEEINEVAKRFCNPSLFSVITVGRAVQV